MNEEIENITHFLHQIRMLKYKDIFLAKGFDLSSDIPYLTLGDLEKELMISSAQDRSIILKHAAQYRPSPEQAVYDWLRNNYLERYHIDFQRSDLTDLNKIANLSLPDENVYDELEIVLPGHRRRLERAVKKLKLEQKKTMNPEAPVAVGRWAKPECLIQAKFDFLCVKAFLFSQNYPDKKVCIDFMVDSGSDVSTIQEEYLDNLNLELLGPIYSCGIHGGNHTNLYKARLKLGEQELDVEVMGSNYNSLGSQVVRHFRHFIDGHHHIWLKGNYKDPVPITETMISNNSGPLPLPAPSSSGLNNTEPEISKLSLSKRKLLTSPEDTDSEPQSKAAKHNLLDSHDSHALNLCQDRVQASSSSFQQTLNEKPSGSLSSGISGPDLHKDTNDDIDHMEIPTANSFHPLSDVSNSEPSMLIWVDHWSQNNLSGQETKVVHTSDSQDVIHIERGHSWRVDGELFHQDGNSSEEDGIDVDSQVCRDVILKSNFLRAQNSITMISLEELEMLDQDGLCLSNEPS